MVKSLSTRRLWILVLTLPLLSGCGRYVKTHAARGDALFDQRKYREAIGEYDKAARFDPANPQLLRQLGIAHYQLGDLRPAFAYLSKAEPKRPKDIPLHLALANIYIIDRRPDEAIRESNAVLALDAKSTDALSLLAAAYLDKREPAKTAEAYQKIVALNPNSPMSHYGLGVGLLAQGKTDEARRELETAANAPGATFPPVMKLIELDIAENKADAALGRVQRLLEANPSSGPAMYLLGAVQTARGDRKAAEAAYLQTIRTDSQLVDARVALGQLYASGGDLEAGIAQLDQAVRIDSLNPNALTMLGVVYQQKGEFDQARQFYERALVANPLFVAAANNLAWLLSERYNDLPRALKLAEMANTEVPDDPHFADTFGWILFQAGDVKRAVTVLRGAADRLPDSPTVQLHLGLAAQKAGDQALARQALTKAANAREPSAERNAAQKALSTLK